ncbi:MAG: four helix bundle protein [Anaerolineales bacterium]|nr:four helix bundle protein [Anaerolineales bacterium]
MTPEELKQRTKAFGLRCIKVVEALPKPRTGDMLARQLVRSGTSVGANYRSACRGRSGKDFVSKVDVAIEEVDESLYWLELIVDAGLMPQKRLASLMKEGDEIVAILTATSRTAKRNLKRAIRNQKSQIRNS